MKPKLVYLSPRSTSPHLTVKYADALAQGGAEVRIMSAVQNSAGFNRGLVKSKVPFLIFPNGRELPLVWRSAVLNMLRMRLPSWALLKALIQYPADFVIAGEPADLGIAWFAAKLHRARLIYIPWEYFPGLSYGDQLTLERYAHFEAFFAPRVHSWISDADTLSELYARQYSLDGRIHTVYNGVPRESDCTPRGLRQRIGAQPDTVIAFYSGMVTEARGLWDVLRALPHTPAHIWFVVLGVGELDPLRSAVREMGLGDRAHVLDPVPQEELMGYTAEADIGIIPIHDTCVSYRHCNPSKFFDYIGAGLPLVVSSRLVQLKRYVETRRLGEVFQGGSPHSLAGAINKLANDSAYRRMCSANVRRTHETEACWEIQAEKLRIAVLGETYGARVPQFEAATGSLGTNQTL